MLAALFSARLLFSQTRPATAALATRRSLFTTPQLALAAAKTAPAKKTVANGATPAKRGRPPAKATDAKKKHPKEETQRVRIPQALKPPKRAPGPYCLFYQSWIKKQEKPRSLEDCQQLSRRAGEIWRGYTMVEKQSFYDENEVRKAQAKEAIDEFYRNTSASQLKQLNRIRTAQGKQKFHSTKKHGVPPTSFIFFSNEFRNSVEGQAVISATNPEKTLPVRAIIAAAGRWRHMSDEEKQPYVEKYEKAKQELNAQLAERTES